MWRTFDGLLVCFGFMNGCKLASRFKDGVFCATQFDVVVGNGGEMF